MKWLMSLVCSIVLFCTDVAAEEIKQINSNALLSAQDNYQLIDVRSAREYNQGFIEGAVNIPFDDTDSLIALLGKLPNSKTPVLYCRSGRRAGIAANELKAAGFHNVILLEGDILGWQQQNLPLVQPQN